MALFRVKLSTLDRWSRYIGRPIMIVLPCHQFQMRIKWTNYGEILCKSLELYWINLKVYWNPYRFRTVFPHRSNFNQNLLILRKKGPQPIAYLKVSESNEITHTSKYYWPVMVDDRFTKL